jgi:DNA-binding NtrC family response regulator
LQDPEQPAPRRPSDAGVETTPSAFDPGSSFPLRARIEGFERTIVASEFRAAGKNQSETARRLGISRPALIERLNKYGLLEK